MIRLESYFLRLLVITVITLMLGPSIPGTLAIYQNSSNASQVQFTTPSFNTVFRILPGTAKQETTCSQESSEPEALPVFREEQGEISLYLGEVEARSGKTFIDVFRVQNHWSSQRQVNVVVDVEGELSSLVRGINVHTSYKDVSSRMNGELWQKPFDFTLEANALKSINIKLDSPPLSGNLPVTFRGDLVIRSFGMFLEKRIPTRVTIIPKRERSGVNINQLEPELISSGNIGSVDQAVYGYVNEHQMP